MPSGPTLEALKRMMAQQQPMGPKEYTQSVARNMPDTVSSGVSGPTYDMNNPSVMDPPSAPIFRALNSAAHPQTAGDMLPMLMPQTAGMGSMLARGGSRLGMAAGNNPSSTVASWSKAGPKSANLTVQNASGGTGGWGKSYGSKGVPPPTKYIDHIDPALTARIKTRQSASNIPRTAYDSAGTPVGFDGKLDSVYDAHVGSSVNKNTLIQGRKPALAPSEEAYANGMRKFKFGQKVPSGGLVSTK